MTHDFVQIYLEYNYVVEPELFEFLDFECSICGIKVFTTVETTDTLITISGQGIESYQDITCDEFIIKKIIE